MIDRKTQIYLISPVVADDAADLAPALDEACGGGVTAVLLRLAAAGERALIDRVKALAPVVQAHGVALVVADPGEVDLAMLVTRGGADGAHTTDPRRLADLGERLKDERIIGAGGLRSRHDAMVAGESGVDYVMFGDAWAGGASSAAEIEERAFWWAEIFQTPCVAVAPTLDHVERLAATGAEFVALGDPVWTHPSGPRAAVASARRMLAMRTEASA